MSDEVMVDVTIEEMARTHRSRARVSLDPDTRADENGQADALERILAERDALKAENERLKASWQATALAVVHDQNTALLAEVARLRQEAMSERTVWWYAGDDNISRMGPYPTQVAAWMALRAAPSQTNPNRVHTPGAHVWCEYAPANPDTRLK